MTDSNKKTIIVNPDSLDDNTSGSISSRTRSKKNVRSKNIKKEALKTLKNYKDMSSKEKDKEKKDIKSNTVKNKNFVDELKESLNILETVSKQRRQERNKTMKLKKERMLLENRDYDEVSNESSSSLPFLKKDPLHGCLKGGKKQTFSQIHKTKKRSNIYFPEKPIQSVETIGNIDIQSKAMYLERQRKLQEMKEKNAYENYGSKSENVNKDAIKLNIVPTDNSNTSSYPVQSTPIKRQSQGHSYNLRTRNEKNTNLNLIPNINELKNEVQEELKESVVTEMNTNDITLPNTNTNTNTNSDFNVNLNEEGSKKEEGLMKSIRKTLKNKKTYELGKKNNQINILVPNNKTRKTKKIETDKIDDISFYNKKRYLEEHGFIKKGSNAPEFVLNELYKNILLSGNVTNSNTEKKLYNYMNKE